MEFHPSQADPSTSPTFRTNNLHRKPSWPTCCAGLVWGNAGDRTSPDEQMITHRVGCGFNQSFQHVASHTHFTLYVNLKCVPSSDACMGNGTSVNGTPVQTAQLCRTKFDVKHRLPRRMCSFSHSHACP